MQPISLSIRKKTLVPTKKAIVHTHRSDWKLAYRLLYQESSIFFSKVKYDNQFAKWLKDNFGIGIYSIIYWKKGQEGFKSFMKIECLEHTYKRLRKKLTKEQSEKNKIVSEKRRIERRLKNEGNLDIKDNLNEDLNQLNEELGLSKEIIKLEKGPSCYPYLKTLMPIFAEHRYDEEYRERPINTIRKRAKIIHDEENKDNTIEEVNSNNFSFR